MRDATGQEVREACSILGPCYMSCEQVHFEI